MSQVVRSKVTSEKQEFQCEVITSHALKTHNCEGVSSVGHFLSISVLLSYRKLITRGDIIIFS